MDQGWEETTGLRCREGKGEAEARAQGFGQVVEMTETRSRVSGRFTDRGEI